MPLQQNEESSVLPESESKTNNVIKNVLYTILICLSFYSAWWIFTHGQQWVDFWRYRFYSPPAEVVAIADKVEMTDEARYIFYVSDPAVETADDFNSHCSGLEGEQTAVLGCYRLQKIFLYDVTDPRLYGIKEVTAAHEMLHAVYERLPLDEKLQVNKLIQEELPKIQDEHVKELAELYGKDGLDVLWNEMHSVLGSEFRSLSPELEQHYAKYFKDRSKVVTLSESYQSVFKASKARLSDYDRQLNDIKVAIDADYAEIDSRINTINAESSRLNNLRATDPEAYNLAVPSYNALVQGYNALVVETRGLIDRYNALVEARNSEAATQNSLYNSLNSHYEPIQ